MTRIRINSKNPQNFVSLMALAMFLSVWLLPTFMWQFGFIKDLF